MVRNRAENKTEKIKWHRETKRDTEGHRETERRKQKSETIFSPKCIYIDAKGHFKI